jgi:hypothetical protein
MISELHVQSLKAGEAPAGLDPLRSDLAFVAPALAAPYSRDPRTADPVRTVCLGRESINQLCAEHAS